MPIKKLATIFKGREISIDSGVGSIEILSIALYKLVALVRGLVKTRKVVFLGPRVTVRFTKLFHPKRGVEIGAGSIINCLGRGGLRIGQGSKIGAYSWVSVSGSLSDLGLGISIGNNVAIGEFAHLGGAGGLEIGDDTITGCFLSIHPENHRVGAGSDVIRLQGVTRLGVLIGRNCWIGAKATFLDGSSIGSGCVVAAGSVVNKKFGDNLIIAGVPAKVVGERI